MRFFLYFLCAMQIASAATSPAALPRVLLDTHYVPATGNSIVVNAGGDLQAAIDNARPGDEIVLAAGARFIGNYTLRAKTQPGTIVIRSSQLTSLPEGIRVGPQSIASLATVSSPNVAPVFTTDPGATSYRMAGLEITVEPAVSLNYSLVGFGVGSETVTQLPSNQIIDRSYIHGTPAC